ncbi:hypothetical protein KCP76_11820 [Salmonella enterica subsp. enterica serovar Weltevreden]|nr:hypothetical protein KCP76_11820 [Salmonella enterica subsp. enterica serovar Weltevreden]
MVDISEVLHDGTPRRDEEIIVSRLLLRIPFRCAATAKLSARYPPSVINQKFAN